MTTTVSYHFIESTLQMNRARLRAKKWLINCSIATVSLLLVGFFSHVFLPVGFKEFNGVLFGIIGLIALSMVSTILFGAEKIKKVDEQIEERLSEHCSKLERMNKQYLLMYFNTYHLEIAKESSNFENGKNHDEVLNEILDLFPELNSIIFELRGLHVVKAIDLSHWRYNHSDAGSSKLMEKVIFK